MAHGELIEIPFQVWVPSSNLIEESAAALRASERRSFQRSRFLSSDLEITKRGWRVLDEDEIAIVLQTVFWISDSSFVDHAEIVTTEPDEPPPPEWTGYMYVDPEKPRQKEFFQQAYWHGIPLSQGWPRGLREAAEKGSRMFSKEVLSRSSLSQQHSITLYAHLRYKVVYDVVTVSKRDSARLGV